MVALTPTPESQPTPLPGTPRSETRSSVPISSATPPSVLAPSPVATAPQTPSVTVAARLQAALEASPARDIVDIVELAPNELRRFGRGKLFDMAVSPRSDLLAVATGLGVWLYDFHRPEDEGRLLPQDSMATAVSWSPDGMHLAAMGFDGVIRIWNPLSGMLESTMGNCQGHIPTELEWSPDGTRIAAYCGDGAAVFDALTGKELSDCAYPVNSRPRFSWSPDGKYLGALVGIAEEPSKNRLDLCRGDTGKFERTLMTSAEDERMTDAAWSPDGSLIAVEVWKRPPPPNADRSRVVSIRLLDPTNGQVVREIKPDGGTISMAWTQDGKYLAVDQGQRIMLFDPETGQVADTIAAYKGRSGYSLWSPGGGFLLDYSADGTASIWDVFAKSNVKAFQGHSDIGSAFPWSTDGRRVAAVNAHETLDMWDADSGQPLARYPLGDVLALSPDWSQAVTRDWVNDRLQVRTVLDGKVKCELEGTAKDAEAATTWSPDGRWITTRPDRNTLQLSNAQDCTPAAKAEGISPINTIRWSRDGTQVAYVTSDGRTIVARNAEGIGKGVPWTANLDTYISELAWSPDGSRLAVMNNASELRILELGYRYPEERLRLRLDVGQDAARKLAWSPDGSRIAAGTSNGRLIVFAADTGQKLQSLGTHSGWVEDLWWSPDSKRLFSSSLDGTVRIWDVSETASLEPVADALLSPTTTPATASKGTAGATPAAVPTLAQAGSLAGQIVFLSNRDYPPKQNPGLGPFDIYAMNPDGSNQRRITKGLKLSNLGAPVVSPDGNQIAVGGYGKEVQLLNADGSVIKTFTSPAKSGWTLDWSSTGKVLYMGFVEGKNWEELYSLDVKTGIFTRLTDDDSTSVVCHLVAGWSTDRLYERLRSVDDGCGRQQQAPGRPRRGARPRLVTGRQAARLRGP